MCEFEKPFIVRDNIECHYHYRLKNETISLADVLKPYLKWDANIKLFFTSKSYNEYIESQIDILNEYNYKKFSHEPFKNRLKYLSPFKKVRKDKRDFILEDVVSETNLLVVRNRPTLVSTYRKLKNYKKNKRFQKGAIPQFLTPNFVFIEFVPYIENENEAIDRIVAWAKEHIENEEDLVDFITYAEYLQEYYDVSKVRSKLDFLLFHVKDHSLVDSDKLKDFQRILLDHKPVTNDDTPVGTEIVSIREMAPRDGLYIIRRNGAIQSLVQYLVYEDVKNYKFNEGITPGSLKLELEPNMYYYVDKETNEHKKIEKEYLQLTTSPRYIDQVDVEFVLNEMVEATNYSRILFTIFIYKKKVFYNEFHPLRVIYEWDGLKGSVHCRGLHIVNIVE